MHPSPGLDPHTPLPVLWPDLANVEKGLFDHVILRTRDDRRGSDPRDLNGPQPLRTPRVAGSAAAVAEHLQSLPSSTLVMVCFYYASNFICAQELTRDDKVIYIGDGFARL